MTAYTVTLTLNIDADDMDAAANAFAEYTHSVRSYSVTVTEDNGFSQEIEVEA